MSARSYDINKVNKKQSNIQVMILDDIKHVYLHGHPVLWIDLNKIQLDHCGYITRTTATAINRGLEQLNVPFRVSFRKGKTYVYNYKLGYELEFVDTFEINRQ